MTLGDVLIVLAVMGTALSCPVTMWIQDRRGRSASCCPPPKGEGQMDPEELRALRRRQSEIEAQLAEAERPRPVCVDRHSRAAG